MHKKASLSLSVNAIVVLILAVVMLGLGLGFVKGMFSKVSTSFEEQASQEADPTPASAGQPITLSRDNLIVHAGDTVVLKFSAYNPAAGQIGNARLHLDCGTTDTNSIIKDYDTSSTGTVGTEQSSQLDLDSGESGTGTYIFVVGSASADTYLCSMKLYNDANTDKYYEEDDSEEKYSKDMVVKVVK